jgi:ATP-dependent DNA helicase RecQ
MPDKFQVLHNTFGFATFRPGQEQIVDTLLSGRHVLAVMPTGSGKSLCYQVPALVLGGLTIVVSPLVALMQDQVAALKLAGVAAESINSSFSRETNVEIWRRVAQGEVRLLYLAPERLMTERMLTALQKLDVKLIAVDEAHCISQWGASFRPEYEALQRLREVFPGVPIGAFTATADAVTRQDIVSKIFGGTAEIFVSGFDRPNIRLTVEAKHNSTKQLNAFLENRQGDSGIIYSLSRKSTEEWAAHLCGLGYRAVAYHAGMSADQREENQNIFMAEKGVIVCATIAFGMGIDKPDVRFVFHADLPATLDAYYQEIGRAGRDGLAADAHMVFGLEDLRMRRKFIDDEDAGEDRRRREHKRLDALIAYCESPGCRRQTLLAYFGETSEPCGNCDVCLDPKETVDGTVEAQKILSTIHRTGQRFGAAHIVDVLEGKETEKILSLGHNNLSVYGIGKDRPRSEWQSLIRQLVGAQFLTLDVAGYGGLSISEKGRALLKGEGQFRYWRDMVRRSKKKEKKLRTVAAQSELNADREELLQRLKALRWKLSKQRHVPPYVIFSDRSLIDMAARLPLTRMDFGEVHGVGAAKIDQFADLFLAEIAAFSSGSWLTGDQQP